MCSVLPARPWEDTKVRKAIFFQFLTSLPVFFYSFIYTFKYFLSPYFAPGRVLSLADIEMRKLLLSSISFLLFSPSSFIHSFTYPVNLISAYYVLGYKKGLWYTR